MTERPALDLVALFILYGQRRYGEGITDFHHALQCAVLAGREGADDDLVLAALVHDIGRLLAVLAAVERHVDAKRYLCTVDSGYAAALSPASVRSLAAQGGPLSLEERARFEAQPWADEAVRLRRWDEAAKDPAAVCAPLEEYRALLVRHLGPQSEESTPVR